MDVTAINNYSITNIDFNKNIRIPATEGNSPPVNAIKKNEINYAEVMMKLEDVKNFFFMLIGGDISKGSADNMKGKNLNTMA